MLAHKVDGVKDSEELSAGLVQLGFIVRERGAIGFELDLQVVFGNVKLMPMMCPFSRLLEAERDDESERDGAHVDEKLSPGVNRVLGRMYFHT